jgi:hypothetical protein
LFFDLLLRPGIFRDAAAPGSVSISCKRVEARHWRKAASVLKRHATA